MIEVKNLTVRYGGVTSLDGMNLTFEKGVCGLIGPNGAGKTTFFNVLSGFVRPRLARVTAFGDDLLRMTHFRRARWGVRRTFQTEQAISDLTVYDNVAMIHSRAARRRPPRRRPRRDRVRRRRRLAVGEGRLADRRASAAWSRSPARSRASPGWILLDEPAAGLPGRGDRPPDRGDPGHPRARPGR